MIIFAASKNINSSELSALIYPIAKGFIIVEKDKDNKVYSLKVYEGLNEISEHYQSSTFYSNSINFTLLPKLSVELLPEEEIKTFLKWDKQQAVHINNIALNEVSFIFQEEIIPITNVLPAVKISHLGELIVTSVLQKNWKDGIMTLCIDSQLMIAVVKERQLQVCNQFEISNNEELIYYVMLMIQEYQLPQEEAIVEIYGEFSEQAYVAENLTSFLRKITSLAHPQIKNLKYSGLAQFIEQNS